MSRMMQIVGLAATAIVLVGCVPMEKYNSLKLERDRIAEQLVTAQTSLAAEEARSAALQKQLADLAGGNTTIASLIANLQSQLAESQRNYDEAMRKLAERGNTAGGPLPVALDQALRDFAAANPDLVDFDSRLGIVKFKSDVTFAVGSADLTPKAKEAIAKFATILNSAAAANYELMVAGHTDNQPVVNPQTKAAGHHDNWYLSAHRAISVGREMITQRVSSNRLGVGGYADQRPIASNSSAAGQAQNRRVEILILPTQVRGTVVSTPIAPPKPKVNKDTPVAPAPRTGGDNK